MRKIIWTYGLLIGLAIVGMFYFNIPAEGEAMDFENGETFGWITMIVALSTIFFAVMQYRKNHSNGHVKFGKAFLIGLYISLIASFMYVLGWEVYYQNFAPNFVEQYMEYKRGSLAQEGLSSSEINAQLAPEEEMMALYKENRWVRMGFTTVEIFPVGLLISLVVAIIFSMLLKPKREKIPS